MDDVKTIRAEIRIHEAKLRELYKLIRVAERKRELAIVADFTNNNKIDVIALTYGIDPRTVRAIVRRNGVPPRPTYWRPPPCS